MSLEPQGGTCGGEHKENQACTCSRMLCLFLIPVSVQCSREESAVLRQWSKKFFPPHETGEEPRLTVMPISKKLALSGPPINKRKLTAGNGPYPFCKMTKVAGARLATTFCAGLRVQMHLDFGQKAFSMKTCSLCGMVYAPGSIDGGS